MKARLGSLVLAFAILGLLGIAMISTINNSNVALAAPAMDGLNLTPTFPLTTTAGSTIPITVTVGSSPAWPITVTCTMAKYNWPNSNEWVYVEESLTRQVGVLQEPGVVHFSENCYEERLWGFGNNVVYATCFIEASTPAGKVGEWPCTTQVPWPPSYTPVRVDTGFNGEQTWILAANEMLDITLPGLTANGIINCEIYGYGFYHLEWWQGQDFVGNKPVANFQDDVINVVAEVNGITDRWTLKTTRPITVTCSWQFTPAEHEISYMPDEPKVGHETVFWVEPPHADPAPIWNFGDGSPEQVAVTGTHTYAAHGQYDVRVWFVEEPPAVTEVTTNILVWPNEEVVEVHATWEDGWKIVHSDPGVNPQVAPDGQSFAFNNVNFLRLTDGSIWAGCQIPDEYPTMTTVNDRLIEGWSDPEDDGYFAVWIGDTDDNWYFQIKVTKLTVAPEYQIVVGTDPIVVGQQVNFWLEPEHPDPAPTWNFGDGTGDQVAVIGTHTYATHGQYDVRVWAVESPPVIQEISTTVIVWPSWPIEVEARWDEGWQVNAPPNVPVSVSPGGQSFTVNHVRFVRLEDGSIWATCQIRWLTPAMMQVNGELAQWSDPEDDEYFSCWVGDTDTDWIFKVRVTRLEQIFLPLIVRN